MNKIIRWYNQNRKQLFIVLLVIAAIILAIHFVDNLVKKDNEKNSYKGESSSSTSSATTTYNPQQSAISDSIVSKEKYEKQSKIIDDFIKYCNEGKTQEAYNLLSDDCKEVMFPTLEYFKNNYYNTVFSENKIYSIKNWVSNIYKVNIMTNMLALGKVSDNTSIEEYFTVITNKEGEYKLNINGFIKRVEINKSSSSSNIEIDILYKDIYMDNVIFTLKAKNNTNKTILLDSGENTQNMYVIDSKNIKYNSYRNEIPEARLKVLSHSENELKIKYVSSYIQDRELYYLVFDDIVLDYNEYEGYILKGNYSDRVSVKVEL